MEDGAVHDHLAVLVADRAVANLADLERCHVVAEQHVGQRKHVLAAHIPLSQRRFVPEVAGCPCGVVLRLRIAEVGGPSPPLPVGPIRPGFPLYGVKGRSMQLVRGQASPPLVDEFVQRAYLYNTAARRGERGRWGGIVGAVVPRATDPETSLVEKRDRCSRFSATLLARHEAGADPRRSRCT